MPANRPRPTEDDQQQQQPKPVNNANPITIQLEARLPDLIHQWCFNDKPLIIADAQKPQHPSDNTQKQNASLIKRLAWKQDRIKIIQPMIRLYPEKRAEYNSSPTSLETPSFSIWPNEHKKTPQQFAQDVAEWLDSSVIQRNMSQSVCQSLSDILLDSFLMELGVTKKHAESMRPLFESLLDLYFAAEEEIENLTPPPPDSFRSMFEARMNKQKQLLSSAPLMGIFNNVVIHSDTATSINQRHRDAMMMMSNNNNKTSSASSSSSSPPPLFWKYQIRRNHYDYTRMPETGIGAPKVWALIPYKVLSINGPSGSGKTMLALEVATSSFFGDVSTLYFKASSNERWIDEFSHQTDSSQHDPSDKKKRRNGAVEEYIKREIKTLLDVKTLKFAHDQGAKNHHVVIVIDEIGGCLEFLRGLVDISKEFSPFLHTLFFPQRHHQQQRNFETRVHFIAVGNVQHVGKSGLPSQPTWIPRIYLKPESKIFKELFDSALEGFIKNVLIDPSLKRTLKGLARYYSDAASDSIIAFLQLMKESSQSPIEAIISNLVTNLRCGVLFIKELISILAELKDFVISSSPVMHQALLLRTATRTISSFFDLNGLSKLPSNIINPTDDVIGIAIVVNTLRFPFLPGNRSASEFYFSDPDLSLSKLLCTVGGGVLVDCGRISREQSAQKILGEVDYEDYTDDDDDDVTTRGNRYKTRCYIVGNKYESRFDCSPAFVAMHLLELDVMNHPNDWRNLEMRFAYLSLTISSKSSLINDVFYQTKNKNKNGVSPLTNNRTLVGPEALHEMEKEDRLITLKRDWLVFGAENTGRYQKQCCGNNDDEIKYPKVVASEFIQLQKGCTDLDTFDRERHEETAKYSNWCKRNIEHYRNRIFNSLVSNSDDNNSKPQADDVASVLVLATVDNEEFADIILLGPYKIVLIRCKENANATERKSSDAFDEEFKKMGMDKTDKGCALQREFVDHLKKMCVRSDDENSKLVKVCSCVVVEGKSDQWWTARNKYRDLTEHSKGNTSEGELKLTETKYKMLDSDAYHQNHRIAVFGFSPATSRPQASAFYPRDVSKNFESATLASVLSTFISVCAFWVGNTKETTKTYCV